MWVILAGKMASQRADDSLSSPPPIVVADPNMRPPEIGPDGLPVKPKKKRKRPDKKKEGAMPAVLGADEKGEKPGVYKKSFKYMYVPKFSVFSMVCFFFSAKKRPRKGATPSLPMSLPHTSMPGLPHPSVSQTQVGVKKEDGEMAHVFEQVLNRFKTLPRLALTEPETRVNFGALSDGENDVKNSTKTKIYGRCVSCF